MNKINCDISSCSHNNSGVCYSNRVDIGGTSAISSCGTCCGSYLNRDLYSDLTSNTNGSGQCDCLVCSAENCSYNKNKCCTLSSISVSGSNPTVYSETQCASFDIK